MEIVKAFLSKCDFFKGSERDFGKKVELLVRLTTKADRDVCDVLASHLAILAQDPPLLSQDQLLLRGLNVSPSTILSAPPPLHLPGGLASVPNPPLSPIPPENLVKSIQKVSDWDCSISQVNDEIEVLNPEETTRRKRNWRGKLEGKVGSL